MVAILLINPLDQPIGRRRLLAQLKDGLQDHQFSRFRFIVAFAKSGPLLRMESIIEARRAKGMAIEAIFGIDQQGTSSQALRLALKHFDKTYITREPDLTFHPKMYAFDGPKAARMFIGSNNLTVGGTETNFESAVQIDAALPEDEATLKLFENCWTELLPVACPATQLLNLSLLSELERDKTVPDETTMRRRTGSVSTGPASPRAPRTGLPVKPASPLPPRKPLAAKSAAAKTTSAATIAAGAAGPATQNAAKGLAIQIKPHHNGEIFLSVTAALQNPAFFKWPFTGRTVPKRTKNPAYPQLTPDPHVNVTVYGASLVPVLTLTDYALNTVYYENKSEIRITASPLVGVVPDYSVMVLQESTLPNIDYDITIHTPASPDFAAWIAACNQTMPGGGSTPRKFGWF